MFFSKQVKIFYFSILFMVIAIAISSCSKKDVVADEAVITPDGDNAAAASLSGDTVDSSKLGGAGDSGIPSSDLQTVYFAYDSYTLASEARSALKANGEWLKSNSSARVQIEGHCDERGTNEYNMALGDRRANTVKGFLMKMGVEKNRLDTISYGEERPTDFGHDDAAWAKNRRASFVLLSK